MRYLTSEEESVEQEALSRTRHSKQALQKFIQLKLSILCAKMV